MNITALIFILLNSILLLTVPRRWAALPILLGACYITLSASSTLEIGPFHFSSIRIIIAVGIIRVAVRRELVEGGFQKLDWMVIFFSFWAILSSFFHQDSSSALVFRLGFVYNTCGIYFLLRIFCPSIEGVKDLFCLTAILLVPLAVEMIYEKITVHNLFSMLGGVAETPQIRSGNVRAQGPFAHAILAGTIGAVCLPLMIGLWHQHRKFSVVGISACLVVVFCSSSSGPIMSALVAVGAMAMWPYRHSMRAIRWLAIIGYLALELVMKAPAYYLIARVDVAGGSTGWHRARLIQSAIEHIDEWWLAGTDFTRHWMPTGVSWSSDHTDITNHYLQMGVIGGLPLTLLFIGMLYQGFSLVGKRLQQEDQPHEVQFFMWSIGASLFAHMATSISVSYFDQSFVFIYLTLAATGSLAVMDESDLINGQDTETSSEQPI
jgi:hypothetical protein